MKNSSKNFLMGTVIGGVIGAFSALLLAPKSGKELRQDIETKSNEVVRKTTDLTNEVAKKTTDLTSEVAKKTTDLTNEVAKKATDLSSDVKESGKDLANYANEKKLQLTEQSKQVIEKVKDWKETKEDDLLEEEVDAVENK
jgi:gas vesicle protein